MKEIKILIRIDEESGKIGFVTDKDKKADESLSEKLMLIGALDLLKQQQREKIRKTFGDKIEY